MKTTFRVGQAVWYLAITGGKSVAGTVMELDSKNGLRMYIVEVCGEVVGGYECQLSPRPVR